MIVSDTISSNNLHSVENFELYDCKFKDLTDEEAGKLLYNMAASSVLSSIVDEINPDISKNSLIMNKYAELYALINCDVNAIMNNKNCLNFPLSKRQLFFNVKY